jgi:hypothetical protein
VATTAPAIEAHASEDADTADSDDTADTETEGEHGATSA